MCDCKGCEYKNNCLWYDEINVNYCSKIAYVN